MESSSLIQHLTPVSWISNSHSGLSLCEIRLSARMRNLTALLFLLLLCSLHLVSSAPSSFDFQNECCSSTTNVKIPLNKIVTYRRTSSNCSIKAIVFETKLKKKICMDPMDSWAKRCKASVDRRKNAPSSPKP
ncbi:C-C motif chemokine 13 [Ictalurus punctatus]|uniref:C-C motif chemokine 13 n=1 Tax=Ictalurus punctatus TaxID=7998 RepID=A0A2D0RJA9_ICTPU|nr:C-C motif chemokine 13 [Ictalurus punctatus]